MEDLTTLTEDELRSRRDDILAELERRTIISSADQRVSDINEQVQIAKGQASGDTWSQPTGAGDAYPAGWQVVHNGKTWESLTPANVWEPGTANWREVVPDTPAPSSPPEWVQPSGATDAYALGSQVSHNGSVWQTTVDANVWEPGVYGWNKIA